MDQFIGKKILVVAADWPWPPNYAARIDVLDRLEVLNELGFVVDLIVTAGIEHGQISYGDLSIVNKVIVIQRKSGIIDKLGIIRPGQITSRSLLSKYVFSENYNYVILEGHYVYDIINNKTLKYDKLIIRVNNDERKYFLSLALSKFNIKSIYYYLDYFKFLFYWKKILKEIPIWMFSSYDEFCKFKNLSIKYKSKVIFLPPLVRTSKIKINTNNEKVLFLGALNISNNLQSVDWYLNNVHNHLTSLKGYEFTIAGRTDDVNKLNNKYKCYSNISFIANPESSKELYENHCVFVNPMIYGSGIKLKTVHALAAGLPVVSTLVGAEGTMMEHDKDIFITNNPLKFSYYIKYLIKNKYKREEFVKNSKSKLKTYYDQKKILTNLLSSI